MKKFFFILLIFSFFIGNSSFSQEDCNREEERASVEVTKVGIKSQKEGNHIAAIKFFDEALKICPHPKVQYFKALSLKALWDLKNAKDILEKIVYDSRVKKYQKEIKVSLKEIEVLLQPIYVVVSSGEIKGCRVYIDGVFKGLTPLTELVDRGPHVIKIERDKFLSIVKNVEVLYENPLHIDVSFNRLDGETYQLTNRENITELIGGLPISLIEKKEKKWSTTRKAFFWGGLCVFAGGIPFLTRHLIDYKNFEEATPYKKRDKLPNTNLYIGVAGMSTGLALILASFLFGYEELPAAVSPSLEISPVMDFAVDFSISF